MEQKSNKLKRNKKDSSKPTERYSLRNKKESVNKPTTRSEKRKIEKEQQELNNKKTKMDAKGKQKAEESSVTPTKSMTAKTEEKKPVENSLDNNDDEEEEIMHEDWDEPKEEEEENEEEEEDDDDDDDDDDELSSVRRTLGLQMSGLFGMMSSDSSKFRTILNSLRNEDDPTMQLIALQELAEILSVSSEDNLVGYFSSDNFCKELVRIMKGSDDMIPSMSEDMDEDMMLALAMSEGFSGSNPEVMLLACRCISNLLEAMPTAVTSVVFHGAIRVLCQKLKSIQYIDLAEQALYALEKISAQLPKAVLHEGGLSAVMMYFDFFSIHAQRTALRTASNCMRGIDSDSFSQVVEITPTLMNTITYSDRSVVELTCHCWVRISESYRNNRESLEKVITVDLLKILFGLIPISGNSNAVNSGTFQDLLRIFRSISKASPQLSFELLKLGIIDSFYQILTGSSTVPHNEEPIHITLDTKWRDSVPLIMKTIVDLLPPLPKDDMFSSKRFKTSENHTLIDTTIVTTDPRVEWFNKNPDVLLKMDNILIPLLLDMYASTVNLRVRQLVTHTLVKLIHYSNTETLEKVLKNVSLSSFLSGILTRQEHPALLIDALYQTELLIKKLPEIYHFLFEREGVLYEIENISKLPFIAEEDQPKEKNTVTEETTSADIEKTEVKKESEEEDEDENDDDDEDDEEDEEDEEDDDDEEEEEEGASDSDNKNDKKALDDTNTTTSSSSNDLRSTHRRLFERGEFQALLRSRYDLLQQQQQQRMNKQQVEIEKGVGKGSTRKHIIQLAKYFVENYADKKSMNGKSVPTGHSLKEISQFTEKIRNPTKDDPLSEKTLHQLSIYLRDSIMGISSFELINSGLMKALLSYLTTENEFNTCLNDRIQLFNSIFVNQPDIDQNGNNALKKLVIRLQEILSRSETFEVVTPLESSNEGLRNPTSMLAKQLRLRLTGTGDDIPNPYKQLMVSTHAVATFRVLEEYLLARINSSTSNMDDEDDDDDEIDEEHLLIDETKEDMDIDTHENEDIEMSETVVVKKDETEDEDEIIEKPIIASSSSSNSKKKEGEWKIQFLLHGTIIPNDSTVYAAVHQYEMNPENEHRKGRNFWSTSFPITYERIWVSANDISETEAKKSSTSPVRQLDNVSQPKELKEDSTCNQVINLLKALSPAIAKRPHGITSQDFINRKLTAKMNRQLEEPLIVASSCLPKWTYWLMHVAPFLFPFETRYLFIQSTSFGYSRLISRWQSLQMRNNTQNGTRNDDQPTLGRMERQKVRIVRTQMLESAIKILDLFGSSPTVLEIEYMGEEGTGMGPTLEFYASTSKEFSKHSLNMWRGSNKSEKGYVQSTHGLFPKTLAKSSSRSTKKIVHLYKTLGQFIAKGLLDFRIIDIPFSPAFFKVVLDDAKPSSELLMEIDPVLGKSISMLQSFIEKKRQINNDSTLSNEQKAKAIKNIQVDGASLEDLCLDFTLPGDQSYELKTGGTDIPVTINNVEEYIELLQDSIAGSGISQQVTAFREGFNRLFAIDDMKLLTHLELVSLFGKAEEDWTYATLADTIRADHGFTMESEPVKYLLEILSNMNSNERREFLQFTTGSPRLPIGGWKALRPVFTVVRKIPEEPLTADDYLPSVMTCANYFKMPAYTSKEILHARLLTSMKEGQNSFLLS